MKNARFFAKNGAKDWKNGKNQDWRGDKHVEPLVANIGVDTPENEPIFGWIQLVQLSIFNSSILSLLLTPWHTPAVLLAAVRLARRGSLFRSSLQSTAREGTRRHAFVGGGVGRGGRDRRERTRAGHGGEADVGCEVWSGSTGPWCSAEGDGDSGYAVRLCLCVRSS